MFKTSLLALTAFALSGCVVAIGDDDWDHGSRYHHGSDHRRSVTVDIDGDEHRFECPRGFEGFYEEDDNGRMTYGCREDG